MIQVNLVPDVKQKYLKAQRLKRVILAGSVFISSAAIALVVLMFMYVNIVQGRHKTNLQTDIDQYVGEIQATENAANLVTIQKQLEALPGLHQDKPLMSRLSSYLVATVPGGVKLNKFNLSFEANELNIGGNASAIKNVNVFVDTLKNAKFRSEAQQQAVNAFSNVILQQIATDEQEKTVIYEITATFNPLIFTDSSKIVFEVPNITSTRSNSGNQQVFTNEEAEQ